MNRLWGVGILQTYILLSAYYFQSRKSQQRRSLSFAVSFRTQFWIFGKQAKLPCRTKSKSPFFTKDTISHFFMACCPHNISFHCGFYIQFYILIPVNNCVMWLQIVCTFKDKQFEVTLHSCFLIKGIP